MASHVKPWRDSTNQERTDPRNGVAACPVHDAAFDAGLLTVNGGLRIHHSEPLRHSLAHDEGSSRFFGQDAIVERLRGSRSIGRVQGVPHPLAPAEDLPRSDPVEVTLRAMPGPSRR